MQHTIDASARELELCFHNLLNALRQLETLPLTTNQTSSLNLYSDPARVRARNHKHNPDIAPAMRGNNVIILADFRR